MPCHQSSDFRHTTYTPISDIEELYRRKEQNVTQDDREKIKLLLDPLIQFKTIPRNHREFDRLLRQSYRNLHVPYFRTSQLRTVYLELCDESRLDQKPLLPFLKRKGPKSESGVLVVTVLTSPYPEVNGKRQRFTCEWNCYYCPNEPGQPRSYLHDEPSVLRANQNSFDPILQFTDRLLTLESIGHPVDKIELLVLGGTWNSYPLEYRETFMRDIWYAANTFGKSDPRDPLSLSEEKRMNEEASAKIIGVTLETRPDCIDVETLRHFRRVGCTRVQLGVQHTDDTVLDRINRQCPTATTKRALKLLFDSGFKVDIHLMPQLPGTTPDDDKQMFMQVLGDPELQADQWKIYPTEITPWTVIERWKREGKYTPYSDRELTELLLWVKSRVHPWIRLNRVVRDIPSQYILGGLQTPNLREGLQVELHKRGLRCRCIRCREVGIRRRLKRVRQTDPPHLVIRRYRAHGGDEVFMSMEDTDETLYAFLRLRLSPKAHAEAFPQLVEPARSGYGGCALIRELHVYGQLVPAGQQDTSKTATQHCGYGARLLREAENYSGKRGFTKISVIAGVGTRGYYRKRGYSLEEGELRGEMMTKRIPHRFRLYPDGMMFMIQLLIIAVTIYLSWGYQRLPTSTCGQSSHVEGVRQVSYDRYERDDRHDRNNLFDIAMYGGFPLHRIR